MTSRKSGYSLKNVCIRTCEVAEGRARLLRGEVGAPVALRQLAHGFGSALFAPAVRARSRGGKVLGGPGCGSGTQKLPNVIGEQMHLLLGARIHLNRGPEPFDLKL